MKARGAIGWLLVDFDLLLPQALRFRAFWSGRAVVEWVTKAGVLPQTAIQAGACRRPTRAQENRPHARPLELSHTAGCLNTTGRASYGPRIPPGCTSSKMPVAPPEAENGGFIGVDDGVAHPPRAAATARSHKGQGPYSCVSPQLERPKES